ncbi:MAG: hypothetical protein HY717_04765 [Planctomycetes bacterium]|nr:hypothetical protein [Planctomycetota bacterium]
MRLGAAILCFWACSTAPTAAPSSGGQVKLTLLKVWASTKEKPDELPKELKDYADLLKGVTKEKKLNSFRLEDKAVEKKLKEGEKTDFKLPKESSCSITPVKEKVNKDAQWALKFQLSPKNGEAKKPVTMTIRQNRSPIITPVESRSEILVLILVYEPVKN